MKQLKFLLKIFLRILYVVSLLGFVPYAPIAYAMWYEYSHTIFRILLAVIFLLPLLLLPFALPGYLHVCVLGLKKTVLSKSKRKYLILSLNSMVISSLIAMATTFYGIHWFAYATSGLNFSVRESYQDITFFGRGLIYFVGPFIIIAWISGKKLLNLLKQSSERNLPQDNVLNGRNLDI